MLVLIGKDEPCRDTACDCHLAERNNKAGPDRRRLHQAVVYQQCEQVRLKHLGFTSHQPLRRCRGIKIDDIVVGRTGKASA
ncbi:hypothetical protein [Rhizobium leguminosarum]|uniref:hypothetical protein n=1 Tax=Rhizobium leguminosarum TaxID=384 RepID=UPI001C91BF03|nr:hypothetical protein [Rhizobium leguminosarum]MBY2907695.1 hypothetical protein [Rhizobium leguminosarum]